MGSYGSKESANQLILCEYKNEIERLEGRYLQQKLDHEVDNMATQKLIDTHQRKVLNLSVQLTSLEKEKQQLVAKYDTDIKHLHEKIVSLRVNRDLIINESKNHLDHIEELNKDLSDKFDEINHLNNRIVELERSQEHPTRPRT